MEMIIYGSPGDHINQRFHLLPDHFGACCCYHYYYSCYINTFID